MPAQELTSLTLVDRVALSVSLFSSSANALAVWQQELRVSSQHLQFQARCTLLRKRDLIAIWGITKATSHREKQKGPECILLPLKSWERQLQASVKRSFQLAHTHWNQLLKLDQNRFHSLTLEKLHLEVRTLHYPENGYGWFASPGS